MEPAKHFTELVAWQLACAMRDRVIEILDQPLVRRDQSLRDDLKRAAESVPNNVAEGFGRFAPDDFRRFLEIGRGSLNEVQNRLLEARRKAILSQKDFRDAWTLTRRTGAAVAGLMRYLRTERARKAAARIKKAHQEANSRT